MSELNLSVALPPDPAGAAVIGGRGQAGNVAGRASGAVDRTRPGNGHTVDAAAAGHQPPNPFADLLSGVLQGTQPLVPTAGMAGADRAPQAAELVTESLAGAPEDPQSLLALPTGAGPPAPAPEAGSGPESGRLSGRSLPSTGNSLPPPLPGEIIAKAAAAAPGAEADEALPPATTRPGVSLADLAYSRQLAEAPGLSTASPADGARPAAALAFAGRALGPSRTAPLAAPVPADDLNLELATKLPPGAIAAPVVAGPDGLDLQQSAANLFRTSMVPGAGADLAGRQIAAFAAGDDSGAKPAGSVLPGVPGAAMGSSAALLGRLGSTTLPGLQPLGDASAFSAGLADRLLMLGGPGAHSARLKLYPEHLGELKVDIRIDDGSAEVRFSTTTAQAREAIEGSLPRLRELFADQGIQLIRTQVDAGAGQSGHSGSEPQQRMAGDGFLQRDAGWRPAAGTTPVAGTGRPAIPANGSRLLDVWA